METKMLSFYTINFKFVTFDSQIRLEGYFGAITGAAVVVFPYLSRPSKAK